jgi:hypothetical protein
VAKVGVEANFTLEELLTAVREQEEAQAAGALTVQELARSCGHDEKWVRAKLTALKAEGKVEIVHVRRVRLDDQPYIAPAYRLVGAKIG